MNESIYAQRRARAIARIMAATLSMVNVLQLDPAITEGLTPPAHFDPAIQTLLQLEALAIVLEAAALALTSTPALSAPELPTGETHAKAASRLKGKRE